MNRVNQRPKVIISTYDDIKNPYYAGGGAISISEVASRLSSKYDLTILTGNYPGAKNMRLNGVQYKRIGPSFGGPRLAQLLFHFILPLYVFLLDFDIWIENLTPPFSTSCLQLYTKKPVIGLVHMLSGEEMERKYKLPFKLIESIGLRTYRYFITPTDVTASVLRDQKQNPTTFTIPNGVQPLKAKRAISSLNDYVLYIGRIDFTQKGLDLLVNSFKHIAESGGIELLIAGTGTPREERKLKNLIQSQGLSKSIKLLGRVEGQRKWDLIRNASMVTVPSRTETFGIVALEAAACGTPVIVFNIPGFKWLSDQSALKVDPFDDSKLAEAMRALITDKHLRTRIKRASKTIADEYTWANTAHKYDATIHNVLLQGKI